jgi:pyruvate/2-oxoacid:ferredoxin oxidoreductase beta subunit
MRPQPPLRETEPENWNFFLSIPELDRRRVSLEHIRAQQVQQPLFEFSGACAGCGETPYLKLLSQLFGDRLIVASATGCSSIYGGNLPTTPWAQNVDGRGPAWSNSLSKTTPSSASAGLIAMTYGNIYVASVAMGAKDEHTLKAFIEAEAYDGPALIIAYSHCIAHGINMTTAMQNQKTAVQSGQWLLYRYNPDLARAGQNPLQLDSAQPKLPIEQFLVLENRFRMLTASKPEVAQRLFAEAQADVNARWKLYQYLAARNLSEKDPRSKTVEKI